MRLYLKITAGLLLLVQAFHPASPQYTTDSPGKPIHKDWLRGVAKNTAESPNTAVPAEETESDQKADGTAMESNNEYNSGIASGYMTLTNEEEENLMSQDQGNEESDDVSNATMTALPVNQNDTNEQPELQDTTATSSGQINMTDAEEEVHHTTATPENITNHLSAQNSSSFSAPSNHTDLQTTTLAPEGNGTQEPTTTPAGDTQFTNDTEPTNSTTLTTTNTPEKNETSTTSSSTTVQSETTETSPETTATAAANTPGTDDNADKGSASGSSSDRGLESDSPRSKRNGAWGAVLGTAVAVACVGLVAYFILRKKHKKGFTHRKLVEEYPSDPVLRLENSDPLDLNFGGSAYYNPGLQGDSIQMTNIPGRY